MYINIKIFYFTYLHYLWYGTKVPGEDVGTEGDGPYREGSTLPFRVPFPGDTVGGDGVNDKDRDRENESKGNGT